MFVNLSNHPSGKWTAEQINAASRLYGEVRDLPFPAVPTLATPDDVAVMADEYVARAFAMREECADNTHSFAVMVQGEFTLTYATVKRFKEAGVTVVSAVSDRVVSEQVVGGEVRKTAIFRFAGFREYV